MKTKPIKTENLKIGKQYYFDDSLYAYGELVEVTDNKLYFKPIVQGSYKTTYNGFVPFGNHPQTFHEKNKN